ncbi:hypothetical protein [Parafrankia sp. EUN1f]|uniref:hypothetical protein n=1 Tax=Parafrankia sp. EUN1f TaxID=102897 RepID=UPI0001C452CB|nr:hypothetical protein [Parafrankia sp. EUN1f]EFC79041.1 hypothetical protein FrEUN1fDRAFT_7835 [Parafrankia sp. EUN1f]
MTTRTVVYDTGMLVALLRDNPTARLLHHGLRAAPHRPVLIGPVLAQAWRPDPKTVHAFSQYLKDCTVPQTRESTPPIRGAANIPAGCVACARTFTLDSYKRAGAMLADATLPTKKRPDVIDALVVITAALHAPAQILTSAPDDLTAYTATLDRADILVEPI